MIAMNAALHVAMDQTGGIFLRITTECIGIGRATSGRMISLAELPASASACKDLP